MPKGCYERKPKPAKPPTKEQINVLREWTDDLRDAKEILKRTPALAACERVRNLRALTQAFQQINNAVRNDLQRLALMDVKPAPENAVIHYHP